MTILEVHEDGAPSKVEIAGIIFVRLDDDASPDSVGIPAGDEPK